MTFEELREEIIYYAGIIPTDEEVLEILDFVSYKAETDLFSIIEDYYNC